MKLKKAFFLGHNGLGDNITMNGAINFLLNYFEEIYFLCKNIHQENVKLYIIINLLLLFHLIQIMNKKNVKKL